MLLLYLYVSKRNKTDFILSSRVANSGKKTPIALRGLLTPFQHIYVFIHIARKVKTISRSSKAKYLQPKGYTR